MSTNSSEFERARKVLGIATGAGKREALQKALHAADAPKVVPAHVLRRAEDLLWIVDSPSFVS